MTSEAFRNQLAALSAEYRRSLPEKFAELGLLWTALIQGSCAPARLAELQRELHTLVGTAKTMGVPAVTDAARAAETFLEPFTEACVLPGPTAQDEFKRLLASLQRSAND